jgi:hypothetical protein
VNGNGELEVFDEGPSIDMLAASLRADANDLESFERVFTTSLAELLPPGCVEIDYERSLKDRLAGKPGVVRAIRVALGEVRLELERRPGGLASRVARMVRGVVISSREVNLEEWSHALAQALANLASDNAAARSALARLLGTS